MTDTSKEWRKETNMDFIVSEEEMKYALNKLAIKDPLDMTALDPVTGKEFLISHSQMEAIAKNTLAMKKVETGMKRVNRFLIFIIIGLVAILISFALIGFGTGIIGNNLVRLVCH